MKIKKSIKTELFLVAILLCGILIFKIMLDLLEYYDNQYGYNITLSGTTIDNGELIAEGLFKLKNIKYKKNEAGQLQIRPVDKELYHEVMNLSLTYRNFMLIPKSQSKELIDDLKKNKIKFASIMNKNEETVFLIWDKVQ